MFFFDSQSFFLGKTLLFFLLMTHFFFDSDSLKFRKTLLFSVVTSFFFFFLGFFTKALHQSMF